MPTLPASRALAAARGGRSASSTAVPTLSRPATLAPSLSVTAAVASPVRFVSSRSAITTMSLPPSPGESTTRPFLSSNASTRSIRSVRSARSASFASIASNASLSAPSSPVSRTRQLATAASTVHESLTPPDSPPLASASARGVVPNADGARAVLTDVGNLLATDIGGSSEWHTRVQAAQADLNAPRRRRLAVIGDVLSAPHDIVSAVLQDPLTDAESTRRAVLDRYYGTGTGTLRIEHALTPERTDGRLAVPSAWLQAAKAEVIEVEGAAPTESVKSTLLSSDAVCVVLDPIRLASAPVVQQILPLILAKGRVQFVVNGPLPPHTVEASLRATLDKQLSQINAPGLHGAPAYDVQFVRADSALSALDALASALDGAAANKGAAIAAFQRDFVASNASPLSGALAAALPADHQAATAGATAHLALAYVEGVVAADRAVLSQARTVVNGLERAASEGAGKAHRLSLVARGVEGGVVEGSVEQSVAASKADIQHLFSSRFSWLGLLARLRVDDVGAELGAYLSRSFARDMETQLVFEAGELAQLQSYLGDRSRETARNLSTKAKPSVPGAGAKATAEVGHPFCSPVLLNHLDSLALSVPPVTARTLLAPVTARRTQLLTTAVPRLQVGAQRALLASAGLGLASAAGAWTLAVPPLQLISGNTAFATALLGIVGALALGQNLWARAQRRWWRDWNRVTDMLKEDLAANYDASVDTLVLARPRAAADGLSELVDRRAHRLDELERSVDALHARVVREQHEHEHEHTNGSS